MILKKSTLQILSVIRFYIISPPQKLVQFYLFYGISKSVDCLTPTFLNSYMINIYDLLEYFVDNIIIQALAHSFAYK